MSEQTNIQSFEGIIINLGTQPYLSNTTSHWICIEYQQIDAGLKKDKQTKEWQIPIEWFIHVLKK